jgi:lysylphosphatidylglycerol synthetase-like protein (DUF2156 family)
VTGWTTELALAGVLAGVLVLRGLLLGRPVRRWYPTLAGVLLLTGAGSALTASPWPLAAGLVAVGALLVWPPRPEPPADPTVRARVRRLVDRSETDPVAAFAQRTDMAYVFSPDRRAALAYQVRFGTAIASGDPIGAAGSMTAAVTAFRHEAARNGWRTAVLGASARRLNLWIGAELRAVPIGRDVVVDPSTFSLHGRRFRNLRQAVRRTYNAGVTTRIVSERAVEPSLRAELAELVRRCERRPGAGFSRNLDHVLDGLHAGVVLAVARDRAGRVAGFARWASSDHGRELSLDTTWRRPDAPNGVNERLTLDMLAWARTHGAERLCLSFAAFPEILDRPRPRTPAALGLATGLRCLRVLVRVESANRYLRKFHALGERRYVLARYRDLGRVAAATLVLEFWPRRAYRRAVGLPGQATAPRPVVKVPRQVGRHTAGPITGPAARDESPAGARVPTQRSASSKSTSGDTEQSVRRVGPASAGSGPGRIRPPCGGLPSTPRRRGPVPYRAHAGGTGAGGRTPPARERPPLPSSPAGRSPLQNRPPSRP